MEIRPDLETFKRRCEQGNLIPVWAEMLADMETPVSAFRKLCRGPQAFLLESVEHGERIGRYSFLGCDPTAVIRSRGGEVRVEREGVEERFAVADPLAFVREFMRVYRPVTDPRLPPFVGGAVGYMAYDLVRRYERLPDENEDDLQVPDLAFMIADALVAFDHARRRALIIANAHVTGSPEAAYARACGEIHRLAARLKGVSPAAAAPPRNPDGAGQSSAMRSNMTPEAFKAAVERAREYIFAGDIFQVVLSQRFERPFGGDPFDVYRALRAVNPSPYMFFLRDGDMMLAGSSPEVLVTVKGGEVILRPIAGTRPRGLSAEEDRALEAELLADPKERAEHIMLVDLGRNDCGRVCTLGSVHVDDLMTIERYSHVVHIVSNVRGQLRPECDGFDAVRAALPAGTLSGAPKIRAMEIIDELETRRRGPYGGAAGYFAFGGNVDTCITIRTVLIARGRAYVQVGAGIVADSEPAKEFEETLDKGKAMFAAIDMAERGLD